MDGLGYGVVEWMGDVVLLGYLVEGAIYVIDFGFLVLLVALQH